jgi:hypothetical protein
MRRLVLMGLLAVVSQGCGSGDSMMGPNAMSFGGMWSGSMSESGGTMMGSRTMGGVMGGMMGGTTPGQMEWQLMQNGSDMTGYMDMAAFRGTGRMTMTGRTSGQTLTFTMTIPSGGMPDAGCGATAMGTAQMSGTAMTGSYSGTNTCSGPFNGQVNLTKRS